jgi:GntR family transcriptional regulator
LLEIDISSPEPVYLQIISQIGAAISENEIVSQDKLPSIRQLASDLEVNPNTVAKAYQILEEFNVIKTQGRAGSIVLDNAKESFNRWLTVSTKIELNKIWQNLKMISPNNKTSLQIWKNALKELRDE